MKLKIDPKVNTIVCGDNLEWLNSIPDESVDLCYIDPPFFSNRNYEIIWGNGFEVASFGDRFSGGISHYIEWMKLRLILIHQKLKDTGSIFLHCDSNASHRLRCTLDEIFGANNFVNEIIWHYKRWPIDQKCLQPMHDNIFYYAKDKKSNRTFNTILGERSESTKKRWGNKKITANHENGKRVPSTSGSEESKGVPIDDVFNIPIIAPVAKERLGYPTQKPEKLISQILQLASNEGDLVLDCFAGGFTTAKVALDLKRRFICGDVSPVAIRIGTRRIIEAHPNETFRIKGLPGTVDWFQQVEGHVFAEMVCDLMGWKVNDTKVNDKGIDGWDGYDNPIQVKNKSTGSVGRPEIQKFAGALIQSGKKNGVFVAWEFNKNAKEAVAEFKQKQKLTIDLRDARDIFKELLITEEKQSTIIKLFKDRLPEGWQYDPKKEFTNGELLKLVS